jgi:phosphopantetheinyl transferase
MVKNRDAAPSGALAAPEPRPPAQAEAPQSPRVERRSPTRPRFVKGWQKELKSRLADAQAASPTTAAASGRVDIWVANPDELLKAKSCLRVLSDLDWLSLNRIQDAAMRRSAIAARVLLRIGLSHAADHKVAPSEWRFDSPALSRPVVAADLPQINFSVSHVDELAVVALSPTLDVGIDVECVDQNVSKELIAEFSHFDERHAVGGLPRPQEIREFIRLWTLKEAYSKMLGRGHGLDFKMIKFTLDPVELEVAGTPPRQIESTQFESFYISYEHRLFHASLAIRHRAGTAGSTLVQIISLADAKGRNAAHAAPLV